MTPTTSDPITALLARWQEGADVHTLVMPLVYRELRGIAASLFAKERIDHTLPPTGLVHEAYLRIRKGGPWKNRAHFFGSITRAMRRELVDHARRHNSQKRGGDVERVDLDDLKIELATPLADACYQHSEILAVAGAIDQLQVEHPRWARIVELRFFGGLSVEETAETLQLSTATIKSDWLRTKEWLKEYLMERS